MTTTITSEGAIPDIFKPIPVEPIPRVALSVAEAAKALGISDRTITSMISRGEIPTVQIGKRRLLPVDGLKKWVAEGCPKVDRREGEQ